MSGNRFFSKTRGTRVMGILNVTPDSFSDGGLYTDVEQALMRAKQMVEDGVDVIDVGAESTRPGATSLDAGVEWARLEPVLRALVTEIPVPLSVDTYRAVTAERAIALGVRIINDISAGADEAMPQLIRDAEVGYVFMHNRRDTEPSLSVQALVAEVEHGLLRFLDRGVEPAQIMVDPGVGFAKTHRQNLACIRSIDLFCELGYPVLLGTSRKRVIGQVLEAPVDERVAGSLATVAYAVGKNVSMVRVHDVRETVKLCRMLEAISREDDNRRA